MYIYSSVQTCVQVIQYAQYARVAEVAPAAATPAPWRRAAAVRVTVRSTVRPSARLSDRTTVRPIDTYMCIYAYISRHTYLHNPEVQTMILPM